MTASDSSRVRDTESAPDLRDFRWTADVHSEPGVHTKCT